MDLSLGGASLRAPTDAPYALGERLSLEIDLPGLEDPVEIDAVVRWVDAIDTARIGVQFATGLRPREVYAVNQLARRQQG